MCDDFSTMFSEKADRHQDEAENLYSQSICRPDEVLYEGSDDEYYESPEIRRARLSAAAKRFLDGDDTFILSSALKGPFEGSSGWANPWRSKRSKPTAQVESNVTPSLARSRRPSRPSQTQNEIQPNSTLECHLLSPESLKQGPLVTHDFMEEHEVARVQNWRTTILSVDLENDAFWAGNSTASASPQTRSRKRKLAQELDWLKGTSKRPRADGENDTAPLRRSRRARSSPNLSNRRAADAASPPRPSQTTQSSISKRRSLKAQAAFDAEDELTSSVNAPLRSTTRRRSSPIKRVSSHTVLKSSQGSSSYSEDELANEDEAHLKAAATLSSPVSNKGWPRPGEQKLTQENKHTVSPRRSKRLSMSPKQGDELLDQDSISQELEISPETEAQKDDSLGVEKTTKTADEVESQLSSLGSDTGLSDAESLSSSAADDEECNEVPSDADNVTQDAIQPKIISNTGDIDMTPNSSAPDSSDIEMDDASDVQQTPHIIGVATKDLQARSQADDGSVASSSSTSSSEESDSSEGESEVGALTTVSNSQAQERPIAVQNGLTTTTKPQLESTQDLPIATASITPSEQLSYTSDKAVEAAPSSIGETIEGEEVSSAENSDSDESSQTDNSGEGLIDKTPVSQLAAPCMEADTSIHMPTTPTTDQVVFTQHSGEIDVPGTGAPNDQLNINTPQSPWSKSQYTQFFATAPSGSPIGDSEKLDPEPSASLQSPWVASQDTFQKVAGLSELESDRFSPTSKSRLGRQTTPESDVPFQPFSAFMTPSPERRARRIARAGPRFSSGGLPSSQALASAMKNPWSSGKANRRVSWAPLPHEATADINPASSENDQLSPSQRQRPSSPPPQVSIADVSQEAGEDRFRDHFDAVARRAAEHPQRILPTESQQTVGSPDACAMAENFIAFNENKTVGSAVHPQKRDSATPRSQSGFGADMDNDDLLEDVFNDIQELLQPWNLDAELEQARKESGNDPVPVDIWAL